MSEESSNSTQVDLVQQFATADIVAELMESAAPHQRALMSVLAVADRHQVDSEPLILSLAEELPLADHKRANELAEQIAEGVDPVDALEQVPELLTPTCVLALRLARDQGTLSELYTNILDCNPGNLTEASSDDDEYVAAFARMAGRVFAVVFIVGFILLKIAPEFQKMLEEFKVEPPPILYLLFRVCDQVVHYWFVPFFLMLCVLPFCFPAFGAYLRRWSPLKWRQPTLSAGMNRRRSLALLAQTAASLKSGIAMIVDTPALDGIFPRLAKANARITDGENEWESLAAERLISKREAKALAMTTSGDTQAWLLRWSAADRQHRKETRTSILMRFILLTMNVAIALIVALTCFAIYRTYIEIVSAMQ